MAKIVRRKIQVNATVSPILAKKIDAGVESEKYSSQSDLVSIALAEHFVHEDQREYEKKMSELYSVLIKYDEGKALLDEVPRTTQEKVDAYMKAGNALTELGEYEDAKKYFEKAKTLESGQLEQPKKPGRPGRITYPSRKEREEECLEEMCPEPRELTEDEKRKAAEAKEYYKKLRGEGEEELPKTFTRKVVFD